MAMSSTWKRVRLFVRSSTWATGTALSRRTHRVSRGLRRVRTFAILRNAGRGRTGTLDIYFIDVEGGQATLLVAPGGETLLVDAGFPGDGTFQAKPGDPRAARDPQRIAAVARTAGVTNLDSLLVTHLHAD